MGVEVVCVENKLQLQAGICRESTSAFRSGEVEVVEIPSMSSAPTPGRLLFLFLTAHGLAPTTGAECPFDLGKALADFYGGISPPGILIPGTRLQSAITAASTPELGLRMHFHRGLRIWLVLSCFGLAIRRLGSRLFAPRRILVSAADGASFISGWQPC